MSFVTKVSKVSKNWNGKPKKRQSKKHFDLALSGDHFCTLVKIFGGKVDFICLDCRKSTQIQVLAEITAPRRVRTVRTRALPIQTESSNPDRVLAEDFQNISAENLLNEFERLSKKKALKIEQCCEILKSEKGSYGNTNYNFSWCKSALNIEIPKNHDFRKLAEVSSEMPKTFDKKFKYEKCGCPDDEKCWFFVGTSQFNELGKVTNRLAVGLNHLGVDINSSDSDDFVGLPVLGHLFVAKLRQLQKTHFWITITIPVEKNGESWFHTIVAQVVIGKKSCKATVIDPNEAELHKSGNHGHWLDQKLDSTGKKVLVGDTTKKKINSFFRQTFSVSFVKYGFNSYGLAKPSELFHQYLNSCNVTVTVNLFFLAVGYTEIPRFCKSYERAIFCRLRRYLQNNEKLPDYFQTTLPLPELEIHVNKFIRSYFRVLGVY